MADVNRRGRRERAQLILVSGLLIAVTLLVLVLLLNTVIYTENVATRGIDSDVGGAVDVQQVIDREVATIVQAEQTYTSETGYSQLHDNVSAGIEILMAHQSDIALERGTIVGAEETVVPGVHVYQSQTDPFAPVEIGGIADARQFQITFAPNAFNASDNITNLHLSVGDEQTLIVNRTHNDAIEFRNETARLCTFDIGDDVTLDLINGSIESEGGAEACEEYIWALTSLDSSTIEIASDDDDAAISYDLVAGGPEIADGEGNAQWFVYEVRVALTYVTPDLYVETMRVIEGRLPT